MSPSKNITYVTTNAQLQSELGVYLNADRVAFDIETTFSAARGGPMGSHGSIRLMQFAVGGSYKPRQMVVDLFHVDPTPVFAILENPMQEILIHNARFEVAWLLYQYGIEITNIFDTCAVWRHIQKMRRERKSRHEEHGNDIGVLADRLLSEHMNKTNQTSDWSLETLDPSQIDYAAYDVDVLTRLASKTRRYMSREGISREEMSELSNAILASVKKTFGDYEDLCAGDESRVLRVALEMAETQDELDAVWRSRRSVSLYYENRASLEEMYRARSREFSPELAVA